MEEIYGYFSVIVRVSYVGEENKVKTERRKYLVQSGTIEAACTAALAVAKDDIADRDMDAAYVVSARLLTNISGVVTSASYAGVWAQGRYSVVLVDEKSGKLKKQKFTYIYNVKSMDEAVNVLSRIAGTYDYEVESVADAGYFDYINALAVRKEVRDED